MAVDKSPERVRDMFDEIAPRYDRLNRLLSVGIDRRWRGRTVRRLEPIRGLRVLDVCAGTGDLALAFWRAARGEVSIVGVDFSTAMLDVARRKIERAGAGQGISLLAADAMHLPFENDRFDLVSVAFGLRNMADTDAGLAEMVRVCRPGGRLAILEFSMPTRWPIAPLYQWYFRAVLPRIGQFLARNRGGAYHYLPASVCEFPQGEAMAERLRAAGLGAVQIHPMTHGIATLYIGVKPPR